MKWGHGGAPLAGLHQWLAPLALLNYSGLPAQAGTTHSELGPLIAWIDPD